VNYKESKISSITVYPVLLKDQIYDFRSAHQGSHPDTHLTAVGREEKAGFTVVKVAVYRAPPLDFCSRPPLTFKHNNKTIIFVELLL